MQGLKLMVFVLLLSAASISQANECIELGTKDQHKKTKGLGIQSTGSYCITDDISVKETYRWNHGWERIYRSSSALGVNAINVKVDFKQHTLASKASKSNAPHGVSIFQHQSHIDIKNGSLRVAGKRALGVNLSNSNLYTIVRSKNDKPIGCYLVDQACEDVSYLDGPDKLPPKYQDAHITIDNMNIFATYRGVQLAGNHNVIRNSVIEVDDNTAIYLMGQYPIIENNTIIIHSSKNGDKETQKKYNIKIKDGAIKLRDAKGGIIRNNKIIYKGGFFSSGKAPVAINLLDSKDVLIENNTIIGFEKLVRENGDTSFTEKSNKFEQ